MHQNDYETSVLIKYYFRLWIAIGLSLLIFKGLFPFIAFIAISIIAFAWPDTGDEDDQ
jgi:TRAP-type mannitol/chloroaromatic compound transport system permease small subunit